MKRIFIAIPFDDEAKRGVKKLLKIMERKHWPVKWEPVEKLHITLAFLGAIDDEQLRMAKEVTGKVSSQVEPGIVAFKGLGTFPDLVWPRVIWLGLRGDLKRLAKVYKSLRQELNASGFMLPSQPFVPHVTLGRIEKRTSRKQREVMGKELSKMRILDIPQTLMMDRIVVYQSELKPTGSVYTEVGKVELGVISNTKKIDT